MNKTFEPTTNPASALPHLDDLFRTARRVLGDRAQAEDIVQEAYYQAWKSFHRFQPGTNCRAWLFKILFHVIHHYRRKWLKFAWVTDIAESEETFLYKAMTRESVKNSSPEANTLGLGDQGETVDLKLCPACASEVRPRDCYCRRCGASQNLTVSSPTAPLTEQGLGAIGASYVTAPLAGPVAEYDVYHSVSGSLVKAITAGLSSSASARLDSRYAGRAMLALISIPIWLIIVLLSPLDAYATARTVIRQQ